MILGTPIISDTFIGLSSTEHIHTLSVSIVVEIAEHSIELEAGADIEITGTLELSVIRESIPIQLDLEVSALIALDSLDSNAFAIVHNRIVLGFLTLDHRLAFVVSPRVENCAVLVGGSEILTHVYRNLESIAVVLTIARLLYGRVGGSGSGKTRFFIVGANTTLSPGRCKACSTHPAVQAP